MVMLPLACVLTVRAVPYTLTATFILRKRRAARRALAAMREFDGEMSAASFGGPGS
ncbi:hypothetical protein [Mycetocola sp.]|uniref:hypothetical protein n=1 Tax=Mycetocola sp. TaxID=1871042 RepID=UPI002613510B|nr:hypothetical protein [Mycetocola sp.]